MPIFRLQAELNTTLGVDTSQLVQASPQRTRPCCPSALFSALTASNELSIVDDRSRKKNPAGAPGNPRGAPIAEIF
jgi:hypothetical protein